MNDGTIGEALAEARRKLGKSIKEVELDTKIRGKYIEALERDDFDCLPGEIYCRGFIKTYASYLGLDAEPLVQQYKGLHVPKDEYDISTVSSNMRIAQQQRPKWFKPAIVLGVAAVIFVSLIAWGARVSNISDEQRVVVRDIKTRSTTETTVASATTDTTVKKGAAATSAADGDSSKTTTSSTTATTEKNGKGDGKIDVTVKLTGIQDGGSWVRVTVDGEKAFEGIIEDGKTKLFEGDERVKVRVGNVSALEVMLNGKRQSQLDTVNGIAEKTFTKRSSNAKR